MKIFKMLMLIIYNVWLLFIAIIFLYIYGVFVILRIHIYKKLNKKDKAIIYLKNRMKFLSALVFKVLFVKVKIKGENNIPKEGPYVIVSNHQSLIDVPLILWKVAQPVFVAKKELIKLPIINSYLKHLNSIFVDRNNPNSGAAALRKLSKTLKMDKGIVCIFPEGTRTLDNQVHEFKSGTLIVPFRYEIPILPLCIDGTYKIRKKTQLLLRPNSIELEILPIVDTSNYASEGELRYDLKIKIEEALNKNRGV